MTRRPEPNRKRTGEASANSAGGLAGAHVRGADVLREGAAGHARVREASLLPRLTRDRLRLLDQLTITYRAPARRAASTLEGSVAAAWRLPVVR
jgi:hypothetical protein